MALTEQQRSFYENTLAVTKQEIADYDQQIEEELFRNIELSHGVD